MHASKQPHCASVAEAGDGSMEVHTAAPCDGVLKGVMRHFVLEARCSTSSTNSLSCRVLLLYPTTGLIHAGMHATEYSCS